MFHALFCNVGYFYEELTRHLRNRPEGPVIKLYNQIVFALFKITFQLFEVYSLFMTKWMEFAHEG